MSNRPVLKTSLTEEQQQHIAELKEQAPRALQEIEAGTAQASAFEPAERLEFPREEYKAEVVRRGEDLHYHFFMPDVVDETVDPPLTITLPFPPWFGEALDAAFIETFKLEDRLFKSWIPELNSWAALAKGFGHATTDVTKVTNRLLLALDAKLAGST